ncbi:MAG TPA: hypothetical protein VNS58_02290 [Puia sp.]|nr:hypothetical protein [Puia sp.]
MSPLNSPLFIFHAAKDFFEKGSLAASENFKEKDNEVKQYDTMIHPKLCMPIVNIVFGLELIFKGISMQSTGKFNSGHNILKLFDALNSDVKDKIILHYQTHD